MPAKWKERAPRVERSERGDVWLFDGGKERWPVGLTATAGQSPFQIGPMGQTYATMRPGSFDTAARLADLDADGIYAQVLYPSVTLKGARIYSEERKLQLACVRAYNDWLLSFCKPSGGRLIGQCIVPTTGLEDAIAELEYAMKSGHKGAVISSFPNGSLLPKAEDEPFWARAEEARFPICVHIGSYSFLEDAVGCRWWSSKVSTIPQLLDLTVPEQHVRYVPPLEYRESFWADAFDGDWAARNKSNGNSERLEDKHGGKIRYGGPFFVHTFAQLVPPATYFKEHPEYFSAVNGQRLDGYAQVCVTNEEVKKLITDKVLAYLRDDPTAQIISVSQNDCDNHCLCADCKKLEEEEGSPAGPLLHLVNHVAAEVGKQYPDVA